MAVDYYINEYIVVAEIFSKSEFYNFKKVLTERQIAHFFKGWQFDIVNLDYYPKYLCVNKIDYEQTKKIISDEIKRKKVEVKIDYSKSDVEATKKNKIIKQPEFNIQQIVVYFIILSIGIYSLNFFNIKSDIENKEILAEDTKFTMQFEKEQVNEEEEKTENLEITAATPNLDKEEKNENIYEDYDSEKITEQQKDLELASKTEDEEIKEETPDIAEDDFYEEYNLKVITPKIIDKIRHIKNITLKKLTEKNIKDEQKKIIEQKTKTDIVKIQEKQKKPQEKITVAKIEEKEFNFNNVDIEQQIATELDGILNPAEVYGIERNIRFYLKARLLDNAIEILKQLSSEDLKNYPNNFYYAYFLYLKNDYKTSQNTILQANLKTNAILKKLLLLNYIKQKEIAKANQLYNELYKK